MKRFNEMVWRRVLVTILVCAGLGFVVYLAWRHRAEIQTLLASVDVVLALAAISALVVSNLGIALVYSELVRKEMLPGEPNGARLISIFLLSQIAKYVPGRVWGAVLQGAAVGPALSIQCLVRVNVDLAAMAAVVTTGAALAFIGWIELGGWTGVLLLLATTSFACLVMVQRPSIRLHGLLSRVIPKLRVVESGRSGHPVAGAGVLGVVGVLLFVLGYCVGWLAMVMAVVGGPLTQGMRLTSMLSVSYLVGLFSMLPAGLGVREAFIVASSAWTKADVATVTLLAIVTRLAMVAVDLLLMPIAGILRLSWRRT